MIKARLKDALKKYTQKRELIFLLIISIIYFMRVIYIDADIRAPWGVLNYQPFDEGAYASLALNKVNFGTINPNTYYGGEFDYVMQGHVINNLIGNVFTYISLVIFGDNYLGLRFGTIIAGYFVILLFYNTLKKISVDLKKEHLRRANYLIFFLMIYILLNFVFYNATRIVETTLFRLLFVQIITYIFINKNINASIRFFLIGFFSVLSIFLVYITNLFIMFALASIFFFYLFSKRKKQAFSFFRWCFLGGATAYILAFIYYYFVWDTTPIRNALDAVLVFQTTPTYGINSVSLIEKVTSFLSSNVFIYNPILIAFLIIGLPYFLKEMIKNKNENILFLVSLVCGLFLQTLISEDYIVRKSLVIFFSMIYLAYYYILDCFTTENRDNTPNKLLRYKICKILTILFTVFVLIYITIYRIFLIQNGTNLDFSFIDKSLVFSLSGIAIFYALYEGFFRHKGKHYSVCICVCLLGTIAINSLFIFKYNFYKNTYSDKKIMQQLGKIADGKIVCFSYESSNTLYNDILPLLNYESEIKKYMEQNPDIYYYGFDNFPSFNTDPNSLNQHLEVVHVFDREFETFGVKRRFALFRYKK